VFRLGARGAGQALGQTLFEGRPLAARHRGERDVDRLEVVIANREGIAIPECRERR
jgi:hypothetical protein